MKEQNELREMILYHLARAPEVAATGSYVDVNAWYDCINYAMKRYSPVESQQTTQLHGSVISAARNIFKQAFSRSAVHDDYLSVWAGLRLNEIAYARKDDSLLERIESEEPDNIPNIAGLEEPELILAKIHRKLPLDSNELNLKGAITAQADKELANKWNNIFGGGIVPAVIDAEQ